MQHEQEEGISVGSNTAICVGCFAYPFFLKNSGLKSLLTDPSVLDILKLEQAV
jgi:hypothetical protein